jgi:hypothetical protein
LTVKRSLSMTSLKPANNCTEISITFQRLPPSL